MTGSAILNTAAFWIAPDGLILPVKTNHIGFVISFPDLFDVCLEEMRRQYQHYDEPWGSEGKARHDIICKLVEQGWIRIRRYRNSYSINVWNFDEDCQQRLVHFARVISDVGIDDRYEADHYMPCNIVEFQHQRQYQRSIVDLKEPDQCTQKT